MSKRPVIREHEEFREEAIRSRAAGGPLLEVLSGERPVKRERAIDLHLANRGSVIIRDECHHDRFLVLAPARSSPQRRGGH